MISTRWKTETIRWRSMKELSIRGLSRTAVYCLSFQQEASQSAIPVAPALLNEGVAATAEDHLAKDIPMLVPAAEDGSFVHAFAVEASNMLSHLIGVTNEATTASAASTEDLVAPKQMHIWFAIREALHAPGWTNVDHRGFWTKMTEISGQRGSPIQIIIREVLWRMNDYYFDFNAKKKDSKSVGSKCQFSSVQAIVELWLQDSFGACNLGQPTRAEAEQKVSTTCLVTLANELIASAEAEEAILTCNFNLDGALLHLQQRKAAAPGNDLVERACDEISWLTLEQFRAVFSRGSKKLYVLVYKIITVIMFVRNDVCTAPVNASVAFKKTIHDILMKPECRALEARDAEDLIEEFKMLSLVEAVLPRKSSMTVVTDMVSRLVEAKGCSHGGGSGVRKHWLDAMYRAVTSKRNDVYFMLLRLA
jgi:hypothetical protein